MTALLVALVVVGALVLLGVAFVLTVMIGMRARNRVVIDAMRRFTKVVTNPLQRKVAGRPGATMSILHHRGRVSGREYATPIGAEPDGDGFVVALPYGPGTDWMRNLRAAGSAVLLADGVEYDVDRPEVVPIGSTSFAVKEAATMRRFGVEWALRVRASKRPQADGRTAAAREARTWSAGSGEDGRASPRG